MNKDYKLEGKAIRPFSPVIMEFQIPQPYVDLLNAYGDEIAADKEKSEHLDWTAAIGKFAEQSHKIEDHIWKQKPNDDLPVLLNWVGQCLNLYVQSAMETVKVFFNTENPQKIKEFFLNDSWIVNSMAGDFNFPHIHFSMVSGVAFLKVPESIEKDQERKKGGHTEFWFGTHQMFAEHRYCVKPCVGKLFLFPSAMVHEVYPFRGQGLRRSMSLNLGFDL